jgi:cyclopropane-fatty-acyl-phospholipid synthase
VLGLARRFVVDRLDIVDAEAVHRLGDDGPDELGRPALHATMTVRDPRAWRLVATGGSAGLGVAYMDGLWDADDLTTVLRTLSRATRRTDRHRSAVQRALGPATDAIRRRRPQDKARDRANVRAHYDLGNAFFEHFLDPTMMYSAAVFPSWDAPLEDASVEKLDRLCRLLDLRPGERVVEIGTGWGGSPARAWPDA